MLDLVKTNKRLLPVGRLDMYTSGALILTDDGDFIYKVTHPKHEITKTYNVTIRGKINNEEIDKLKKGVDIGGFTTNKADVKILHVGEPAYRCPGSCGQLPLQTITRLQITIHEGKNRQIRRMMEAINKRVLALHRSKIGNIDLKGLKIGEWRYLRQEEINELILIH